MKNSRLVSYVIPCYNSEKSIKDVVKEIKSCIETPKYQYEIILVNDGSSDNTINVLRGLAKKDKNIKVINLSKNFGQHAAIITGLRCSRGEIVICLDDDGQTPAKESIKLIEKIELGYDAVYARYDEKKHSFYRNIGSKINDIMACILINKPKDLYISSYFAVKKYIVKEIVNYDKPYPYIQGLVLRSTSNICNVDVNHKSREFGTSGYNLRKLINLWMNGFTAFSIKPLRIATSLGFTSSIIGFFYGLILIIRKLNKSTTVLGYSSIMSAILFMGGIIMIVLGLIGEYIGRIYISISDCPQTVIKEKINIK